MNLALMVFLVLISISGLLHIIFDYQKKWSMTYIFKPLTMIFIISLVVFKADLDVIYNRWIVLGLVLSLLGDIFLMLRPQKFLLGLVSFLLAHIAYSMAFYSSVSGNAFSKFALVFLPILIIYLAYLWKKLDKFKFPVLGYFLAIGAMLSLASALFLVEMSLMSKFALLGAILFAFSDGVLAFGKFVKEFKIKQFLIMSSYFSAQTLLALSAVYYWN